MAGLQSLENDGQGRHLLISSSKLCSVPYPPT